MRIFACVAIGASACVAGCGHGPGSERGLAELRAAPLYTFSETEIDAYLGWLHAAHPGGLDRVALLGRQNVGQPYRLFLLGEGPFELHDPDPLYCLSASDCVTFVEHTYAMALASDWRSFFRTLQRIRYRDGEIGMLTRNHFTEADWNVNNGWLFEDVTSRLAPGLEKAMRVSIGRSAFFAKYGLEVDGPQEAFETTYIPGASLEAMLPRLQDGDVVEIVRGGSESPYVGHMGLILHSADGRVTILHSAAPVVREEPFLDYVGQYPDFVGAKFLRMWDPAEGRPARAGTHSRGARRRNFSR
ncbi:MAG: DUF1460 domain-containing protein [Planctomycetota bacterium]|nr:DUF1460 domain-containing protein [Planctomycetota bacterium]